MLQILMNFIEAYNINLLNLIFLGFSVIIAFFGSLVNLVESKLPNCIRQSFRYGKHSHKGPQDPLVSQLEVPKSWFSHFYIFAFLWALMALCLVLKGVVLNMAASEYVIDFLDLIAGGRANRTVQVDSTTALVAVILMTLQCGRRFYETNYVQIFSAKSKINFSHYLVGYIHYFAAITAILANTEGFVRDTLPTTFSISKITVLQYLCILIFHYSWTQQYKSNMILVNLRKDSKDGKVITEKHLLPKGGYFELISSPHMFFEVVMYMALMCLLFNSTTWGLIGVWVLSNQILNALLTHQWYKDNFKDYPKNRKAIIPYVL